MAPYHCHHASVSVSSDVIKNRDLGIRQIQPYPCNLERGSCWASHLTLILCFLIWNRDGSYECYMSGDLLPAWHWAWPRQGLDRIHCDCGAESKGAYMPLLQITGHSTLCAGQTPTWYFYWGPLASLLKSDDNCGKEGTKSSQAQLHVWSESEDCLPFLQLAQDYISSCGKKTLHEVLEKVFKSFRSGQLLLHCPMDPWTMSKADCQSPAALR
ncbi:maturin isoform X3 [Cricetulus griseus]|uniref:Maturin n=1 Tax=Cricetulus griseus TaxID=10029 RepID=A0A9J7K0P6_CRIGR|nr:maturin isoform X3 [Cricetulus griseus]